MSSQRYEAVLFDFDGVLADTEPLHFESWREALAPIGVSLDWDFYRTQGIGVSDQALLAMLAERAQPPRSVQELWAQYARKQQLFLEKAKANPPVPESIRELIASLRGYKLAVVTSTSRVEIEPLLELCGLGQAFQALVCAEDVSRHKPDPEPYREAARRLDVTRALVVEDSEAGQAAGEAAGFDVVRVSSVSEVPRMVWERLRWSPPRRQ